jgi:hypothetical protein
MKNSSACHDFSENLMLYIIESASRIIPGKLAKKINLAVLSPVFKSFGSCLETTIYCKSLKFLQIESYPVQNFRMIDRSPKLRFLG